MKSNISTRNVILLAAVALIPEYLTRCNLNICYWFYNTFSTYFGDLWYCWNNYLSRGFSYPSEYPSLIQLLFRLIALIPGVAQNYTYYLIFPVVVLGICALGSTYFLCKLQPNKSRILWMWIFAPSYLFYGLYNVDFLPILAMILSYYFLQQDEPVAAVMWLAIGAAIKVFPVFLLPIYLLSADSLRENNLMSKHFTSWLPNQAQGDRVVVEWQPNCRAFPAHWMQWFIHNKCISYLCKIAKDNKPRLYLLGVFLLTWLLINIPFMIADRHAWIFPYVWQIQSNFARDAHYGSWTWIIYWVLNHFGCGEWSGKVSLLLFAASYFYLVRRYWNLTLVRKLMIVMILFLLTDRVYSPQYNLYLLPFLVLVDYKINWKYFYLLEIPNLVQCFFLFTIHNSVLMQQSIIVVKYVALIMLLLQLLREPILGRILHQQDIA